MAEPRFFTNQFEDIAARRKVYASRVLLVEGSDELWFFDYLLERMHADPSKVQIVDYGGKDNLKVNLQNLLRDDKVLDGDVEAIAITRDIDEALSKALYDLKKAVKDCGFPDPPIGQMGPANAHNVNRLGLFLVPDGVRSGNLETLLLATISEDAALKASVELIANHAGKTHKDSDKRIAQAYLATRAKLRRGIGRAARDDYFDLEHEALGKLRNFVADFAGLAQA